MENKTLNVEDYDRIALNQVERKKKEKLKKIFKFLFYILIFPIIPIGLMYLVKLDIRWYSNDGEYNLLNDKIILAGYFLIVWLSWFYWEERKKVKTLKNVLEIHNINYSIFID